MAGEDPGSVVIEGRVAMCVEDFAQAWRFLPQVRGSVAVVFVIVLLVPAMMMMFNFRDGGGNGLIYAGTGVLTAGAAAYGMWRGRMRWAKNALHTLRGEEGVLFRFDDYGFHVTAPGRESRLAWSEVYRSIDTALAFLVYTAPHAVVIVPKRAFASAEVNLLQALLIERVRPRPLAGTPRLGRFLLLWLVLLISFFAIRNLLGSD
jgi:hypothetical protein